jgi:ABC-type amino acid transport system permease subunit
LAVVAALTDPDFSEVSRGIPILVLIFFVYYGLPAPA